MIVLSSIARFGNDPGLAAADPAALYIDVENPLESLRLGHGHMTIGLFVVLALLCCVPASSFSSPCWRN